VVAVETTVVRRGSIAREVEVSGVVEPIRSVGITSQLSTTVRTIGVEEGDRVARGAVLARLDDTELALQLESARTALEVARATYERSRRLREQEIITLAEFERDRTAYAAAEAAFRQLETRSGYAMVRSPIGGVVTEKYVEAGDVVGNQDPLLRVADVSTLVVQVGVSELDVGRLAEGDSVGVSLDAHPGRSFAGTIRRIFPSADPQSRLIPVEVALEVEAPARPGFLARVRLRLDERSDVPIVPAAAILTEPGSGEIVFVVESSTAVRREVETGLRTKGRVEIVRGVESGEVVVVQGNSNLREGVRVRSLSGGAPREIPLSTESAR